jgi:ADP-ribosylglycohydrolase
MISVERVEGCLLGLALGDALGAPFEGGPAERMLWRVIGRTREGHIRWTDDTQMSIDLCESLVERGAVDADDLAARFARSYRWSRGYGPGAAKVLKRIAAGAPWREASRSVYPEGSFGNGGAMRAPVVGLFYAHQPAELAEAARVSASVTHAHPLAMEGAVLVARATALAAQGQRPRDVFQGAVLTCRSEPFTSRAEIAGRWLGSPSPAPSPEEVRRMLGNGIAAAESCVTALYLAARFMDPSFEELQAFVASCRGDTDTIGSMAGAVWGAANGAARMPQAAVAKLERSADLSQLADALHGRIPR